jgi:hypothetical protein
MKVMSRKKLIEMRIETAKTSRMHQNMLAQYSLMLEYLRALEQWRVTTEHSAPFKYRDFEEFRASRVMTPGNTS